MPANSLIVGVDLAPIKPIPRTITFQSDITTDRCRAVIRHHLKTWKADTVLHDGAPNVGVAWVQDAFSQAELALQALKLTTDFLVEGGTFVTKVFRSKDYNALLWVFNQLFSKVEATKPPSSRNVSAEIFVVCRGFKTPKRIDPKFLDPRSVFAELTAPTPNNEAKVFNPEKKKRKREGYEEGDHIQYKEASASEYIHTSDPIAILGTFNKLSFVQPPNGDIALAALNMLPETTDEVRNCCQDLKVLGRKEFRLLLRWRLKAREIFSLTSKKKAEQDNVDEEVAEVLPMDEELRIQEETEQMNERESSRRKREKKRENERKQREIVRMQLHMTTPKEIGLEQAGPKGEDSMFALAAVDRAGAIERVAKGRMVVDVARPDAEASEGDEESDLEEDRLSQELNELYNQYQERKSASDAKHRAKKSRTEHEDGEWEGFSDDHEGGSERYEADNSGSSDEDIEEGNGSRIMLQDDVSPNGTSHGLTRRASMFFHQDVFKDIGDIAADEAEDSAIHMESENEDRGNGSKAVQSFNKLEEDRPKLRRASSSGSREERKASIGEGERRAKLEVVQDLEKSHWDRQGEARKDGHLGEWH